MDGTMDHTVLEQRQRLAWSMISGDQHSQPVVDLLFCWTPPPLSASAWPGRH
jgi:hypothetical protein